VRASATFPRQPNPRYTDPGLFQNPVGFEPGSWKNRQKPGFSTKFKEAVPKEE
jgi:hypothetical protein